MSQTPGQFDDSIARQILEGKATFWVQNRGKIDFVLWRLRRRVRKAKTACEVGIGEGYLLAKLAEAGVGVTGVDISGYLVRTLGERFRQGGLPVTLVEGSAEAVSIPDDSLDLMFCLDVLEHMPGDAMERTLEAARGWLREGGALVATLPLGEVMADSMVCCPKCGHEFHRMGHHRAFADVDDVRRLLEGGFRIVAMGFVPPSLTGSRLLDRLGNAALRRARRLLGYRAKDTLYIVAEPVKK
jgi:hypothetical protein